jgi:hypothetical protein
MHTGNAHSMSETPQVIIPESCPADCQEHRGHVYILCYGQPVVVRDCDHLHIDPTWQYPKTHYVGYTGRAPIVRIREHGNRSAHFIAAIIPGGDIREMAYKLFAACPTCGGSLWYYGESPTYQPSFREGIERSFLRSESEW